MLPREVAHAPHVAAAPADLLDRALGHRAIGRDDHGGAAVLGLLVVGDVALIPLAHLRVGHRFGGDRVEDGHLLDALPEVAADGLGELRVAVGRSPRRRASSARR